VKKFDFEGVSQVNGNIAAAGEYCGGKKIKAKIYRGAVGTFDYISGGGFCNICLVYL